jgi:hypothetical protein
VSRDYERLSIQDFGAHLLRTGDLDPVYIALVKLGWPRPQLARWLVAYWCFYDCGFACYVCTDPASYWDTMLKAAINEEESPVGRWPRGRERRHFRGHQSLTAVMELQEAYPNPDAATMVDGIVKCAPDYNKLTKFVRTHRGFGPWISFKVADMTDRVLGVHVDFTEAAVFMFKDPVKAAVMYWNQKHGKTGEPDQQSLKQVIIPEVVSELTEHFSEVQAPPLYDRPVNLQEVETVLCKWKSHMNGHYPLNNDIHEISEGLLRWAPYTEEAADFLAVLPEAGP